jgi:hypothetical protein
LDGTPVLDIKPYLPYADALPQARGGFAEAPPECRWQVEFAVEAAEQVAHLDPTGSRRVSALIEEMLRRDPRPGYLDRYPQRSAFVMRLYDLEVRWTLSDAVARVTSVAAVSGPQTGI